MRFPGDPELNRIPSLFADHCPTPRGKRLTRPLIRGVHGLTTAIVAALVLSADAASQQGTGAIEGRVSDLDGLAIVGAFVTLVPEQSGASRSLISDDAGRFFFGQSAPGSYSLRAQRIGFLPREIETALEAGQVNTFELVLTPDTIVLEGVVVEGRAPDRERERFEQEAGITARVIEAADLRTLPGLGETDVLRAVQLLPGVVSTSDFSSSFNVRGGSADQNLILLDGFPVFNPFHLGGVFSVFNSDAVDRVELLAGGFGAEFGGRVSSVLNIESRDAQVEDGVEVVGGISFIATRMLVRGNLPDRLDGLAGGEGGSWFISARRSYIDQLLRPFTNFPYHLTDLQGRASLGTPGGGRIGVSAYAGRDVLDLSGFGLADDGGAADILRLRWDWGNRLVGLTWDQPFAGDWHFASRLGYTTFSEFLRFIDFGDVRFDNRIDQVLARGDLRRVVSPALTLSFGAGVDLIEHLNLAEAGGTAFFESDGRGSLASTYASTIWRPTPAWIIEPGLRADIWTAAANTRSVLSPRFAAKRFFGPGQDLALKVAAGRYTQFIHSLRDEELPISNDTWVLADRFVPHVVSDQIQLGIEGYWADGWSASVEAYGRRFDGVTEFNFVEDPNDPADDLLPGDASSVGIDMLLRRSTGRITGWAALSLLRAERTFPDLLALGWDDLAQSVSYPPAFDRRVNFDLVAQYLSDSGLEIGARWNYGTGLPYSRPVAQYFTWRHNPVWGRAEPMYMGPEREGMPVSVILGSRNEERYPAYHRLDVTVRKPYERRWGSYIPYLQILNLYNRQNVLFYFYDYNGAPPTRSGFSMFPFLPAIGVEVAF